VRDYADSPPNRVVRFVQLGFDTAALESKMPWLCAGCLTCTTRCPQEFDLAGFMDAIRQLGIQRGVKAPIADMRAFHKAFLAQIEAHGRAYEMGLVVQYKLATMHLMQDVDIAPEMFMKGKIGVFPHRVHDTDAIKRIFQRAAEVKE
jgi:heterodisulfide reductase subunit C